LVAYSLGVQDHFEPWHTELLEVVRPDPFIPAIATATTMHDAGPYPVGGYLFREGWERYGRYGPSLYGD
jgi:hypothetical protein